MMPVNDEHGGKTVISQTSPDELASLGNKAETIAQVGGLLAHSRINGRDRLVWRYAH
jgi:hypothetical protein